MGIATHAARWLYYQDELMDALLEAVHYLMPGHMQTAGVTCSTVGIFRRVFDAYLNTPRRGGRVDFKTTVKMLCPLRDGAV